MKLEILWDQAFKKYPILLTSIQLRCAKITAYIIRSMVDSHFLNLQAMLEILQYQMLLFRCY